MCPLVSPFPLPQDYLSRSTGKPNKEFERSVQLFRERCGARLHWGKVRRGMPGGRFDETLLQWTWGGPNPTQPVPLFPVQAGWPSHAKCFDGSKEYPKTWCHMGCAVQVGWNRGMDRGTQRGRAFFCCCCTSHMPANDMLPLPPCWLCLAGAGPGRKVCQRVGRLAVGGHPRRRFRALCVLLHAPGLLLRLRVRAPRHLLSYASRQALDAGFSCGAAPR